jgi:hypothetical protein
MIEHPTNQNNPTAFVDDDMDKYMDELNDQLEINHIKITENWEELQENSETMAGSLKIIDKQTFVIHRLAAQVEILERANFLRELAHGKRSDADGGSSAAEAAVTTTALEKQASGETLSDEDVSALFMHSASLHLKNDFAGLRCLYDHSAKIQAIKETEEKARLEKKARIEEKARLEEEARLKEKARLEEEARLKEEVRLKEEARLAEKARIEASEKETRETAEKAKDKTDADAKAETGTGLEAPAGSTGGAGGAAPARTAFQIFAELLLKKT